MNRKTRNLLIALSHNEELSERLRYEIRIELGDIDGRSLRAGPVMNSAPSGLRHTVTVPNAKENRKCRVM